MSLRLHEMSFDVNTIRLINLVKERPPLWDRERPESKKYTLSIWADVARNLKPEYTSWGEVQRNEFENLIRKKWKNVKDQYVKTIKRNNRERRRYSVTRKQYIYHDILSFLAPGLTSMIHEEKQKDGGDMGYDYDNGFDVVSEVMPAEPEEEEEVIDQKPVIGLSGQILNSNTTPTSTVYNNNANNERTSPKHPFHENDAADDNDNDNANRNPPLKRKRGPRGPYKKFRASKVEEERHVSFFKSLLPSLRDFDMDEILQFQANVIGTIQNIRSNRRSQKIRHQQYLSNNNTTPKTGVSSSNVGGGGGDDDTDDPPPTTVEGKEASHQVQTPSSSSAYPTSLWSLVVEEIEEEEEEDDDEEEERTHSNDPTEKELNTTTTNITATSCDNSESDTDTIYEDNETSF